MSKQSYNADAMRDAMEVACQVWERYGEDVAPLIMSGLPEMVRQRRMPYDHPAFQAAYAAICLERDLPNQYITIDTSPLSIVEGDQSCES